MTKKHYEAIAEAMRFAAIEDCNDASEKTRINACHRLADYFEKENPKFNRERFLIACGVIKKS